MDKGWEDLVGVFSALQGLGIEWMIVGSFSLFIKGLVDSFNDIDIIVHPGAFPRVSEAVRDLGHSPELRDHGNWQELSFSISVNGRKHEVSIITSGNDDIYIRKLAGREFAEWKDLRLPLIRISDQADAYRETGKKEKAGWMRKIIENL